MVKELISIMEDRVKILEADLKEGEPEFDMVFKLGTLKGGLRALNQVQDLSKESLPEIREIEKKLFEIVHVEHTQRINGASEIKDGEYFELLGELNILEWILVIN